MADQVSVPDSGAGSGSSTATFGLGLRSVFAMPANLVDASDGNDSGTDAVSGPNRLRRKKSPRDDSQVRTRSLARVSPSHGITSATSSSRSPSSKMLLRSTTDRSPTDPRGRSGDRKTSGQASGFVARSLSDKTTLVRRRAKPPTSSGERQVFTPTRLDTPHFTPTRVDTPFTLPHPDPSAGSSGAVPIPNGVPRGYREGSIPAAPSGPSRGINQPTQLYSPQTIPGAAQRDHMDDSQAGKRAMEPSSLPQPPSGRPRTSSPRIRTPEPLSYLPEQVSPASGVVMNPIHMTRGSSSRRTARVLSSSSTSSCGDSNGTTPQYQYDTL